MKRERDPQHLNSYLDIESDVPPHDGTSAQKFIRTVLFCVNAEYTAYASTHQPPTDPDTPTRIEQNKRHTHPDKSHLGNNLSETNPDTADHITELRHQAAICKLRFSAVLRSYTSPNTRKGTCTLHSALSTFGTNVSRSALPCITLAII